MRRWSQVEAQWELATLMTHPKTPINNIFEGTLPTGIGSNELMNMDTVGDVVVDQ